MPSLLLLSLPRKLEMFLKKKKKSPTNSQINFKASHRIWHQQDFYTSPRPTPAGTGLISLKKSLKETQNFQPNWILQISHYYCRKLHKKVKNSHIIEQNLIPSLPFSLFTVTCASCHLPQRHSFFISWTQYSSNFKHHKCTFMLYIYSFVFWLENGFLHVKPARYHCFHKKLNFQ